MKPIRDTYSAAVPSDFADRLLNERMRRQLNQKEMGRIVGVSAATICEFELGRRIPTRLTYAKLVQALPNVFEHVA